LHEEPSSIPRVLRKKMRLRRGMTAKTLWTQVAPVRRPITDERAACQADPCGLGLFRNGVASQPSWCDAIL